MQRIQKEKQPQGQVLNPQFTTVSISGVNEIVRKQEKIGYLDSFLDSKEKDWDSTFSIDWSLLPLKFVSHQLADKILFIGKAIRILQNAREPDHGSFVYAESILQLVS